MDSEQKTRQASGHDIPDGLREIAEFPSQSTGQQAAEEKRAQRQKTGKEQELDALISHRQSVIEQLKAKNPLVLEARKSLSLLIPSIRGKGSSRVMELVREEEKIEFSIATEAYTPKKEKELLKRLREIHAELSKHKELDAARKKVDAQRSHLHSLVSEIRSLERQLADARKACDDKYSEVLAERKAAYEFRQRSREQKKQRQLEDLRERVRSERRQERDAELSKYTKDYDDTVSMEEIVQFEKKEKKKD